MQLDELKTRSDFSERFIERGKRKVDADRQFDVASVVRRNPMVPGNAEHVVHRRERGAIVDLARKMVQ